MREYFLKTERIGFSKWAANDLALARCLWGDEQVTRYLSATGKWTDREIQERLQREIGDGSTSGVQYWPIFDLTSGDFIGCCGLRPYDEGKRIYEMGFHLRPLYWGKGLAAEAARAVIGYAFTALKAGGLSAGHNPRNTNSKRLIERLGFRYSGDEYYAPTGLYHPSYRYHKE